MQLPGADLPYGKMPQRPRAQIVRLFLVFTSIWQEDDGKIFKAPRAL